MTSFVLFPFFWILFIYIYILIFIAFGTNVKQKATMCKALWHKIILYQIPCMLENTLGSIFSARNTNPPLKTWNVCLYVAKLIHRLWHDGLSGIFLALASIKEVKELY